MSAARSSSSEPVIPKKKEKSSGLSEGLTAYDTLGSFKLQFSFGFVTSCYVIMNISIA